MTRIQEPSATTMEPGDTKLVCGKSLRPVRNRRYSRRTFGAGQRPAKRLFTPEIKRYLKDWLVRRRDNPYPNRDEKKTLATDTGLTYIQICNWFANWRRKLKNVGVERNRKTWGHLIKTYNDRAQGNVEQFSISSDDSIWGEAEAFAGAGDCRKYSESATTDSSAPSPRRELEIQQCYLISSTTEDSRFNHLISNNNTYVKPGGPEYSEKTETTGPLLLSKWLESAARFQPSESNYSWWADERRRARAEGLRAAAARHGRAEVEAAVALTALAAAAGARLPCPTYSP